MAANFISASVRLRNNPINLYERSLKKFIESESLVQVMVCPVWCPTIINTADDLKSIVLLGTKFNENLIKTPKKFERKGHMI